MGPRIACFVALLLGAVVHDADMAYLDVGSFFNVTGNLTRVTWAHAVNNKSLLTQALNSSVMMLEADVVIGNFTGTNQTNIPIMAHPPALVSDLSLENFLYEVLIFNTNTTGNRTLKGVKLDFKTIEALETSVPYISNLYARMNYPVWINADILPGPVNPTSVPVNATRFFAGARAFGNSTLSIGWTTSWGANANGSYANAHVSSMTAAIVGNGVNQTVTFAVRAGPAANSIPQMQALLGNVTNSTLTIWSSQGDAVNATNLRNLIQTVGVNRTFIDVPAEVENQLNLNRSSSSMLLANVVCLLLVLFNLM